MSVASLPMPTSKVLSEVKKVIGPQRPEYCYQCAKCTSGCTASKFVPDYKPHMIVAMAKMGYVEELLKSGIIWACSECWKCAEYCPQDVAPVEVVIALKNIATQMNIKPPKPLNEMALTAIETGRIFKPMEVMSRDFELLTRETLNLPPLEKPPSTPSIGSRLKILFRGVVE